MAKPFLTGPFDLQIGFKELGYSTVTVVKMLSYLTMVSFRGIPYGQPASISPLILFSVSSLHLATFTTSLPFYCNPFNDPLLILDPRSSFQSVSLCKIFGSCFVE